MLDSKLASRIYRQYDLMSDEFDDNTEYDKIVAMEYRGIPNLKDKPYYVEHIDTTGRDVIQQAVNIYSTQKPKWNVLPRGLGDIDTAKEFEKIIEWYMDEFSQMGEKRFHSEALIHACKYNKVCAQLEWKDDLPYCVKMYHPNTVVYEFGSKLHWVSVVNNVTAVSVIEHWNDYAKPDWLDKLTKGDSIGKALRELQELTDEDPEQRVMYIDYTDDKKRYTYFYPVTGTEMDDSFGLDDDGKPKDDVVIIQDKKNELGYINWAIARGEGDSLLAPLHKGNYFNNICDLETLKATLLFRRAFYPMFIQHGRSDQDADVDMSGDEVVMKAPDGSQVTATIPPPLDPGFNELSAQINSKMINSVGVSPSANMQMASNVQHSTLQEQIKLKLMSMDSPKKVAEQLFIQIAKLIFMGAKKKNKVLKGSVLYASKGTNKDFQAGSEVSITSDMINLDALRIKCSILVNNQSDKLQLVNQVSMLSQIENLGIPTEEFIEYLDMGDPDTLRERYESEKLRQAVFSASMQDIMNEPVMKMQKEMATFQAQLQAQMQQMQLQMQAQMAGGQGQGQMQGQAPAQQGAPLPSDQMVQGQGANAAMGGIPPQVTNSGITQAGRPQ